MSQAHSVAILHLAPERPVSRGRKDGYSGSAAVGSNVSRDTLRPYVPSITHAYTRAGRRPGRAATGRWNVLRKYHDRARQACPFFPNHVLHRQRLARPMADWLTRRSIRTRRIRRPCRRDPWNRIRPAENCSREPPRSFAPPMVRAPERAWLSACPVAPRPTGMSLVGSARQVFSATQTAPSGDRHQGRLRL